MTTINERIRALDIYDEDGYLDIAEAITNEALDQITITRGGVTITRDVLAGLLDYAYQTAHSSGYHAVLIEYRDIVDRITQAF